MSTEQTSMSLSTPLVGASSPAVGPDAGTSLGDPSAVLSKVTAGSPNVLAPEVANVSTNYAEGAQGLSTLKLHSFKFDFSNDETRGVKPDAEIGGKAVSEHAMKGLSPGDKTVNFTPANLPPGDKIANLAPASKHIQAKYVNAVQNAGGTYDVKVVQVDQKAEFLPGAYKEQLKHEEMNNKDTIRLQFDWWWPRLLKRLLSLENFDYWYEVAAISSKEACKTLNKKREDEEKLVFHDFTEEKAEEYVHSE